MREELTQDRLKEVLHYEPETGVTTRRKPWGRLAVGDVCGTPNKSGYTVIRVLGKNYRRDRLAVLYMTGSWPEHEVDHADGDRSNDEYSNLRPCTKSENQQNRKPCGKTSGYLGVSWCSNHKRWRAQIKLDNRVRPLGFFTVEEDAHSAYLAAKSQLHTFQPTVRYHW